MLLPLIHVFQNKGHMLLMFIYTNVHNQFDINRMKNMNLRKLSQTQIKRYNSITTIRNVFKTN